MEWEVSGAHRETGVETVIYIEADDREAAIHRAAATGLMVLSAEPVQLKPILPPQATERLSYVRRGEQYFGVKKRISGLGIASIVVGCSAGIVACFPIWQIMVTPIAAVGLIFGGLGVFVAVKSKRHGVLIPAIGAAISLLALLLIGLLAIVAAIVP